MNQILQTESKKSGPIEINKVIIFFSIAIIILGVILVGQGSYAMINLEEKQPAIQNTVPEVEIQRTQENILIHITHTKPIISVTYSWNDEEEKSIQTENQSSISEEIALPYGSNTLNLTVIDQDGNESKYVKEYILDGNGSPVIELLLTNDRKIRIKAQDMEGLKNIRYAWNNDDYTTVEANSNNSKIIDQIIEIPLGQNTLKVEAVNINDKTTTKELEVKGVKRPVVSLRQDGKKLLVRAEDDEAMKIVNITLNGVQYQLNFGEVKVIQHAFELQQGENKIELSAENKAGGITEVNGICIVE